MFNVKDYGANGTLQADTQAVEDASTESCSISATFCAWDTACASASADTVRANAMTFETPATFKAMCDPTSTLSRVSNAP